MRLKDKELIPGQQRIIAIINADLARHPDFKNVKNPVTIEHTPYKCPKCSDDCWIGPQQLSMATLGGGEVLCYKCLFKSGMLRGNVPVVALNPDLEDAPRRFPK